MDVRDDLLEPIVADTDDAHRARWESAIRRERWRWASSNPCPECGEWIGHWGGGSERAHCEQIPMNVPLEEVRPNCYTVRRYWIGDAIRAACERRGVEA